MNKYKKILKHLAKNSIAFYDMCNGEWHFEANVVDPRIIKKLRRLLDKEYD